MGFHPFGEDGVQFIDDVVDFVMGFLYLHVDLFFFGFAVFGGVLFGYGRCESV